jgi:hypothetical protein
LGSDKPVDPGWLVGGPITNPGRVALKNPDQGVEGGGGSSRFLSPIERLARIIKWINGGKAMDTKEGLSVINMALEALSRAETAADDLRVRVLELGDRGWAVLGIQLDKLLGEFRAHLEGLLEACEDNIPTEPGDDGP